MSEPMTEARLAEIRPYATDSNCLCTKGYPDPEDGHTINCDYKVLLAEIDRLRPIEALAQQLLDGLHLPRTRYCEKDRQYCVDGGCVYLKACDAIEAAKTLGMEPSK